MSGSSDASGGSTSSSSSSYSPPDTRTVGGPTAGSISPPPSTQQQQQEEDNDPDMAIVNSITSSLVSAGLMAPEHQMKILQSASAAIAKIDELRSFLDFHFDQGRTLLGAQPPKQPARQQVLDSVSSTVLSVNRIQSTFPLLSDAGQDAVQKAISIILSRLMAVLDDFKKHIQYQNWSVSFTGGIPPQLEVGVQITFQ
jgi:hypothetical protein